MISIYRHRASLICIIIFFASIIAVSGYSILDLYGIKGCILCYYQRIPYLLNCIIGIFYLAWIFFLQSNNNCVHYSVLVVMLLMLLVDMGIAAYHILVMYGFVISACTHTSISDSILNSESLTELYDYIVGNNDIDCSSSAISILGQPLPVWNFLFISCIIGVSLFIFYYDKAKVTKADN